MALSVSKKTSYYQNTKKLLDNNSFYKCVQTAYNLESYTISFYNRRYFKFKTTNKFLDGHTCYYNHTKMDYDYQITQPKTPAEKQYQELHLQRNKTKCVIVIGDELLGALNENNIEKRLLNGFAGNCAQRLDSDLYSCNINDLNNTNAVFHLEKILTYLTDFNYEKIEIVFQLTDPHRCMSSIWWKIHETMRTSYDPVLQYHPSYQFISFAKLLEYEALGGDLSYLKNMHYFTLNKHQNGYIVLNPREFFQIYEWSITDLISHITKKFKNNFKIDIVIWRDYYVVCNQNNPIPTIQKTWIEFIQEEDLNLPFTSNYDYIKSLTNTKIEEPYGDILKDSTAGFWQHFDVDKVCYNIVKLDDTTKVLFENKNQFVYHNLDQNWLFESDSKAKDFANYILRTVGWLK